MPPKYKIPLSIFVVLTAIAVSYFQFQAGQGVTPWVALALGGFMVFAMWVFPEEQKEKPKK